jgi:DNA gyrase subunit B
MTERPSFITSVRNRPGMYVGPTDQRAVYQIVQYACEAALSATPPHSCSQIWLKIAPDHSFELLSDGYQPEMDATTLPQALTKLATDPLVQPWSAAVNIAILNALAEQFCLELHTGEQHISQWFAQGYPQTPVVHHGLSNRMCRRVTFVPDRTILTHWNSFSTYPIMGYLRTIAALHAGLRVTLQDERDSTTMVVVYQAGIRSYLSELTYAQIHDFELYPQFYCHQNTDDITAEVALQLGYSLGSTVWSYVNGQVLLDGGSHISGLRQGLAQALDRFARHQHIFGDDIPPLRSRNLPRTLAAIINIRAKNPQYVGAMKRELKDHRIARFVRHMLSEQLPEQFAVHARGITAWATHYAWFIRNPKDEL